MPSALLPTAVSPTPAKQNRPIDILEQELLEHGITELIEIEARGGRIFFPTSNGILCPLESLFTTLHESLDGGLKQELELLLFKKMHVRLLQPMKWEWIDPLLSANH